MSGAGVPVPPAPAMGAGRQLGRVLAHLWRCRVLGSSFVPAGGPVVLAANHTGWLDGPLLFGLSPRPVHVLAKDALFTGPADTLMRAVGQVPLAYEGPDRAALHTAVALLRDERAVGVFPEAHRGRGDFARFRDGVAYLVAQTGAPVVPVAILGTRAPGSGVTSTPAPGARIDVLFGRPFTPLPPADDPLDRAELSRLGASIRAVLVAHVERALAFTGRQLPTDDPYADREAARLAAAVGDEGVSHV